MQRRRLIFALALTLAGALVIALVMDFSLSRRLALLERQQSADLQSLRQLVAALRQRAFQQAPPEAEIPAPAGDCKAALASGNATIERLTHELSDARASIQELQTQLANSSEGRDKALASASEREQTERADWQKQLGALKQDLEAAQADSQTSRQRLAVFEADNARLTSSNLAASARADDLAHLVGQLQDIDSRREALLTSIMRRYRDVTSQFRAMSGMLDSGRESNSGGPLTDAALTRIQNAVSSADDDLRQLTELNAQARQLEKKLAKK